jgi:hypothetical protein
MGYYCCSCLPSFAFCRNIFFLFFLFNANIASGNGHCGGLRAGQRDQTESPVGRASKHQGPDSILQELLTLAQFVFQEFKKYEKIRTLMSRERSFAQYRNHLKTCSPPCMPYMGVYLTDLVFIDEGNPTFLENGNLVNFEKSYLVARVIQVRPLSLSLFLSLYFPSLSPREPLSVFSFVQDIRTYQLTPYALLPVPFIQEYLSDLRVSEEKELYMLSLAIVPRYAHEKHLTPQKSLVLVPVPDSCASCLAVSNRRLYQPPALGYCPPRPAKAITPVPPRLPLPLQQARLLLFHLRNSSSSSSPALRLHSPRPPAVLRPFFVPSCQVP